MYTDKTYPFKPLPLCYDFKALEECLGCNNLAIHYNVIYQGYLNRLNAILQNYPNYQTWSLDELLFNASSLPTKIRDDIIHNAGGVFNHQVFFSSLSMKYYNLNNCPIKIAIEQSFGSFNNFEQQFISQAMSVIGSGYVFLVCNEHGLLTLMTTKNQDTTIPYNLYPLMGIDMWEHSYYLKFTTHKEQYIKNFLALLNWPYINQEYVECQKFTSIEKRH